MPRPTRPAAVAWTCAVIGFSIGCSDAPGTTTTGDADGGLEAAAPMEAGGETGPEASAEAGSMSCGPPAWPPPDHRATAAACPAHDFDSGPADECVTDSDCPGNGLCSCASVEIGDVNVCIATACHVDGDCGPRGYCSPSVYAGNVCDPFRHAYGYYCHQPSDVCTNDGQCCNAQGIGFECACAYHGNSWGCWCEGCD